MGESRPLCRHCHDPLPAVHAVRYERAEQMTVDGGSDIASHRVLGPPTGHGYLAEGWFCTLRCGYRWAVEELKKRGAG